MNNTIYFNILIKVLIIDLVNTLSENHQNFIYFYKTKLSLLELNINGETFDKKKISDRNVMYYHNFCN